MTVALRTALIWHDEVMADVVLDKPAKVTIGKTRSSTFVVPDVGLPKNFAIVRPGRRGYLLTLGERMRGTVCIDGRKTDVVELQRNGDQVGGFTAMPISGRDWGVIDLDETGTCKLFFQFVPHAHRPRFWTPLMIVMAILGWVILAGAFTAMHYFDLLMDGYPIEEAATRGAVYTSGLYALGGAIAYLIHQDAESQLSLAFSIVLHACLFVFTYYVAYDGIDPFKFPGSRAMPGGYNPRDRFVAADIQMTPSIGKVNSQEPAAAAATKPKQTATRNEQGAAGGKGETERARDPNAQPSIAPPKVGVMTDKNRKVLDNLLENDLGSLTGRFAGITGERKRGAMGFGTGTGTGVGTGTGTGTTRGSKGTGTGGGGNVEGDHVTNKGKIDTGKERPGGECRGPDCKGATPKEVKVQIAEATGDFGGLTREEIDRVVKQRAGVFRACYQKELNRTPGIGGKMIIRFVIGGDGIVKSAATDGGTFTNDGVASCVKSNIMRLKFPAKGGANVKYPFVFTQGG